MRLMPFLKRISEATVRSSFLVSVCDDFTGEFLADEIRVRVFPSRGGAVDVSLTHDQAADLATRLLSALGVAEASKPEVV